MDYSVPLINHTPFHLAVAVVLWEFGPLLKAESEEVSKVDLLLCQLGLASHVGPSTHLSAKRPLLAETPPLIPHGVACSAVPFPLFLAHWTGDASVERSSHSELVTMYIPSVGDDRHCGHAVVMRA